MDATRRVVLTGVGVVSSIGIGVEEFLAGLRSGRSGAGPITAFDTAGFARTMGAPVVGFDAEPWVRALSVDSIGPATRFGVAAARMALQDAGREPADLRRLPGMISIGTTDGESQDLDRLVADEVADASAEVDPVLVDRIAAAHLSTAVAREFSLTNVEAITIPTACAAGNYAIGYGYDAVRAGKVDYALCGGADAMCRKTFAGFYRLGAIAPQACQPFDLNRQGILTGEGAAVLMLESLESATARGARVYAEVLGFGLNCDAYHQVAPHQDSLARVMRLALRDAGVAPGDVDLISAHGTGTKANDVTEVRAVHEVYGAHPPPTVSVKSMLGHAMGAASALAAVACALAIVHGFIPPTINHVTPDPECDIDCVPNTAVPADLRIVQNNALAFGGNNAVLLLGRVDGVDP